jgi:hypothetical protein
MRSERGEKNPQDVAREYEELIYPQNPKQERHAVHVELRLARRVREMGKMLPHGRPSLSRG